MSIEVKKSLLLLIAGISFLLGRNFSTCLYGTLDAAPVGYKNGEHHQQQLQRKKRQRLEFVHIPKTGGTAIESIAANANISWSICHFGIGKNIAIISKNLTHCPPDGLKYDWPYKPKFNKCPWWHVPPDHVNAFFPEHSPYVDADLFAVVRNPYERVISEYYYVIQDVAKRANREVGMNDANAFNDRIKRQLTEFLRNSRRGDLSRKIPGNDRYFVGSGHTIPQYDFIYNDRHRKVVEHVLRFETLQEDFSNLMAEYNLPLKLPKERYRSSSKKELGVQNLTKENMLLIENLYWQDFVEFGYEVLSIKEP